MSTQVQNGAKLPAAQLHICLMYLYKETIIHVYSKFQYIRTMITVADIQT